MIMTYNRKELTFSSISVKYSYNINNKLINSRNDHIMTGFRLSWRIENPLLVMATSELGRSVQTPGLRDKILNESFHTVDRAYKASLVLPDNIQVDSGNLVIQLEVDTREEEGWQEEVSYSTTAKWGPEKYKLYIMRKSWSDAEAHCKGEGGHLASVLSEEDQQEVSALAAGNVVLLGGSDQDQ